MSKNLCRKCLILRIFEFSRTNHLHTQKIEITTFCLSGNETEEWEAELEGELNEFEMVSSKGDEEGSNDPEWENQIEQMLEAEEKQANKN